MEGNCVAWDKEKVHREPSEVASNKFLLWAQLTAKLDEFYCQMSIRSQCDILSSTKLWSDSLRVCSTLAVDGANFVCPECEC